MPDDKSGREKQAKRREQRQRRRELEEAIKRLDEPEPSEMEDGEAVEGTDDIVIGKIVTHDTTGADSGTVTDNNTVTDSGTMTDNEISSDELAEHLLATDRSTVTADRPLHDASNTVERGAVGSDPVSLADPIRVSLSHLIGDGRTLLNTAGDDQITRGVESSEDSNR